jgi:hypothetical protein
MEDKNNVYIGRAGIVFIDNQRFPKQSSPFCNPFKISTHGTREEVIQKYRTYIVTRLENDPELKNMLMMMEGKNLGCWCYPEVCHGDILLELMDVYKNK